MSVLSNSPRCTNNLVTVGDALSKLTAFNAIYESGKDGGSVNNANCSPNEKAAWRNAVREGVVNCAGVPTELDFFERAFNAGGKTERVDATDLYIKSNCDIDFNIFAAAQATGSAPGAATNFTVYRANYGGNGAYSNVAVNGSIYIYEDRQWVRVTAVDKTVAYAHVVTVVPWDGDYTVNIRKGKQMMFTPVRFADGLSCAAPSSTWMTPGYIQKVSPLILRKDWEQPIDLSRGYQDVLQFAIMFNHEGLEVDGWIPYEQQKAREEFKFAKNMMFFMGTKITNSALIGTGLTLANNKYTGFDGYLPTMRYGGGTVYDYDTANGFSLDADLLPIILRQDSLKKSKNFLTLYGLNFMAALTRNNADIFKNSAGQNNLNVFKQMGMSQGDIEKLEIDSYKFLGYNFNFKRMDALTDKRSIGNFDMPYTAMMIPLDKMPDSKGKMTPAMEFYTPYGMGASGSYFENGVIDHRYLSDACDKWSGYVEETLMMAIHCPQNHILLNGVPPCA